MKKALITAKEIREALKDGKTVNWSNGLYKVIEDFEGLFVICTSNGYMTGLDLSDLDNTYTEEN
jgi:hypothetical protein